MATRYYFPYNTTAANAPVTTFPNASAWTMGIPAGYQQLYLVTRKRGTPLSAENGANFAEVQAAAGNMIHKQYVSDPIAVDTSISGTFTWVMRAGESNTGADASLQCVVRIIGPDGTVRGTLYGGHTANLTASSGAVGQEFATTTQVRLMNGVAVTPVDALAGDRLVVEIGVRHHNVTTATNNTYLHLGDSLVADHALGTTTQAAPGWFQLSADVGHKIAGDGIAPAETTNATSTGIKVGKATATLAETVSASSSGQRAPSVSLQVPFDGTDEATPTTTGTGLATVTVPAGSSITYEDTGAWKNQYVEFNTGATATAPQAIGTISPARSTMFARFYMRFYALPSADVQVFRMRGTSFAQRVTVRILSTGHVQLHNGVAVVATSVNPVAMGKWVMFHVGYTGNTMTLKTYEGNNYVTPSKTITGAATVDTIQSVMFGVMNSIANWKVDFDEATFDYQNYPEPVGRQSGSGAISSVSTVTPNGFKRGISAGWGIYGFPGAIVSTGAKAVGEFNGGTGSMSGTSNVSSVGKKVAKGTGTGPASTATTQTSTGKKIAKGLGLADTATKANLFGNAESGTLGGFAVTSNATAIAAAAKSGSFGYRMEGVATPAYLNWDATNVQQGNGWGAIAGWFRVNSHATSETVDLISIKNTNGVNHFDLFLTNDNRFKWDLLISDQAQTPIQALGTWHYIECRVFFGATTYTAYVRINGVEQQSISSVGQVATTARSFWFGTPNAKTYQFDADDLRASTMATDTGYIPQDVISSGAKDARGTGAVTGTSSLTSAAGGVIRRSGSGTVSGLAIFAKSGKKIAKGGPSAPIVGVTTTLGSSGKKASVQVTGAISATAGMASLGRKVAKGSSNVTGVGELSAATTIKGYGTLVSTGRKVARGAATVTGVGAQTGGIGFKDVKGSGTISGFGIATLLGTKVAKGQPSTTLTAVTTTLGSSGLKGKVFVTGLITAFGGQSSVGRKQAKGSPTLSGTVVFIVPALKRAFGDGAVYNGHSLTSVGGRNTNFFQGTGSVSGTTSATSTGRKVGKGQVTLAGIWTLSKVTRKVAKGTATVTGAATGPTDSVGSKKVAKGIVSITAVVGASGVGSKNAQAGQAIINGFIDTDTSGTKKVTGTAAIAGNGTLSTGGGKDVRGSGLVAGSGGFSSTGTARQQSSGVGNMGAVGGLTAAQGFKRVTGTARIDHSTAFGNNGVKRGKGSGVYAGTGSASGLSRKVARGHVTVAGTLAQGSAGRKLGKGSVAIYGVLATDATSGRNTHKGSGVVTAAGMVAAFGDIRDPREPIRVGGKAGAVLIGSSLSLAVPIGGYNDD